MKKYSFQVLSIAALALVLSISSCLKDDAHYTDFAGVSPIVDIPQSANIGAVDNQAFLLSPTPSTYSFDVKIETVNPTTSSTDVTIGIDQAFLKKYNADLLAADSTNQILEVLPDSAYTLASSTVTIPAGQVIGTFKLSIKTTKIDISHVYALPYTIKSATNGVTPSANYGTKLIIFGIKNAYAGLYHSIGAYIHPVNGTSIIDKDKILSTINANTSETEYGSFGKGYTMQLTVNPDNTVKITPTGNAPSLGLGKGTLPNGVNKYDPVKQTFTLNYKYAGATGDRVFNEVITLK